jgi:hypothetical protein
VIDGDLGTRPCSNYASTSNTLVVLTPTHDRKAAHQCGPESTVTITYWHNDSMIKRAAAWDAGADDFQHKTETTGNLAAARYATDGGQT